jgi:hypothetical protein
LKKERESAGAAHADVRDLADWLRSRPGSSAADPVECCEVRVIGVGDCVEVLLGGGDLGVAHSLHHRFEVGAAGEEARGVGVAEVVDADVEVDAGGFDGG